MNIYLDWVFESIKLFHAVYLLDNFILQSSQRQESGTVSDEKIEQAVEKVFDLTPAGMIETLDLQNPFYARTAVGGHFGREDFPWERVDKVGLLLNAIL